jgi:hypothetical protein
MKKTLLSAATVALALGFGAGTPSPAKAQSAACVHLLAGAGYSAWMAVRYQGEYHWSSSFPIGQHRCIELPVDGMSEGDNFGVVVSAALGESKVSCKPVPQGYDPDRSSSLVYHAWGQTLNVHCQMPNADSSSVMESMDISPSDEGMEALQKHLQEGAMPPPSND